ncbi:MAG: TIGR04211 family SH3 domain-containing protein [Cellvibrionaceae bacterium]|nr:TIGR04211 family SH3 domain-containing protein [Cellvibrionaceae bacterium]MCV6626185.1 TIGR04211 family SH3 domain-containing protein [Cellvibrionaceae bacterium]
MLNTVSRICALSGLALALLAPPSLAQKSVWISDVFYVPVRKGPTSGHSILHRGLKSGTKLRYIDANEQWTQVETDEGIVGWIPNQYVSDTPIAAIRLEMAKRQAERSKDQAGKASEQLQKLEQENQQLRAQLTDSEQGVSSLSSELSQIKQISASAIDLNNNYQQLAKDHQLLQTELDVAKAENERLKKESSQKWFMYGAGAVLLGVLIAMIVPAIRPTKRRSEWG